MRPIATITGYLLLTTIAIAALLLISPSPCQAAPAHLSFVPQEDNSLGKLTLIIDKVDKLAGMKVTITYSKELLRFVKAEKAKGLSNFMHVVNDKNPGTIIVVMASASGVSGTNLPLLHLEFAPTAPDTDSARTISVTQIQLMNENLQEITGDTPTYTF